MNIDEGAGQEVDLSCRKSLSRSGVEPQKNLARNVLTDVKLV